MEGGRIIGEVWSYVSWIRFDGLILTDSSNMAMTCVRTLKKSLGSLVPSDSPEFV